MPMTDPYDIEANLWARFDAGTNLGDGKGELNRNKNDTEKDGKSNRQRYRRKIEELIAQGLWTDEAEQGVQHCAKKAGATARLIAEAYNENNCTLKIFNLACDIIAKCQAIDAEKDSKAQGIIC